MQGYFTGPMRLNEASEQGNRRGAVEEWSNSEYILKLVPTGFGTREKKERRVFFDYQVLGLSNSLGE